MPTPTLTFPDLSETFEQLAQSFTTAFLPIADELAKFGAVADSVNVVSPRCFAAEVDAGVAFLDEHYGREVWLPRVDLDTLHVGYDERCVLAQVTGREFDEAVCSLNGWAPQNFDWDWPVARGFALREDDYPGFAAFIAAYDLLTDAWEAKVIDLRALAAV